MHHKEHTYFELLKQRIAAVMMQTYPGMNPSISEWKGQEITDFQEELRTKVNANISEKWFYTHIKGSHPTLPRIDMLNFLSRYAGYANWDDFIFQQQGEDPLERNKSENTNRFFYIIPLLAVGILLLFFLIFKIFNTREYKFTFIDADTREPITSTQTEITLLKEKETPIQSLVGADGRFHLKTDQGKIKMVIRSPYYHTDTIERVVTKLNTEETILLRPEDYSMMIHYFSTMKVDDWEKRRNRLNEMFDDGAMIYQIIKSGESSGMILYNKQEFIDKLTIPSGSLKNIEILSSTLHEGKISVLRFRVKEVK